MKKFLVVILMLLVCSSSVLFMGGCNGLGRNAKCALIYFEGGQAKAKDNIQIPYNASEKDVLGQYNFAYGSNKDEKIRVTLTRDMIWDDENRAYVDFNASIHDNNKKVKRQKYVDYPIFERIEEPELDKDRTTGIGTCKSLFGTKYDIYRVYDSAKALGWKINGYDSSQPKGTKGKLRITFNGVTTSINYEIV
ncbi:MAG: hypothetical protein E7374_00520 [Clostridiales bacterium]|nr:hypothetical protein [Clostridiales bacterium]